MDAGTKMPGLVLLLVWVPTNGGAASNSTADAYSEPEEISDSIPVAITILVILILLLLIFIIVLLLVCIRLLSKSTRSKDLEHDETLGAYTIQQHSQSPAQRCREHVGRQQQGAPVVYASPQTHRSSDPKTYSVPTRHVCMCNECKEIQKQQGNNPSQT